MLLSLHHHVAIVSPTVPPSNRFARPRLDDVGSPFDVSYSGEHEFAASADRLWEELQRVGMFGRWWPWMKDVHLEGEALAPGSVISFAVDPPVPYRMDVSVEVRSSRRPVSIEGAVSGDLLGTATLDLHPRDEFTSVEVSWDVELANPRIRAGILIARPILIWAQRWAVEVALRGFRSHLESADY